MAVDRRRRYYAEGHLVIDRAQDVREGTFAAAEAESVRLAKRIANALNLYRPKVRRSKPAEKAS